MNQSGPFVLGGHIGLELKMAEVISAGDLEEQIGVSREEVGRDPDILGHGTHPVGELSQHVGAGRYPRSIRVLGEEPDQKAPVSGGRGFLENNICRGIASRGEIRSHKECQVIGDTSVPEIVVSGLVLLDIVDLKHVGVGPPDKTDRPHHLEHGIVRGGLNTLIHVGGIPLGEGDERCVSVGERVLIAGTTEVIEAVHLRLIARVQGNGAADRVVVPDPLPGVAVGGVAGDEHRRAVGRGPSSHLLGDAHLVPFLGGDVHLKTVDIDDVLVSAVLDSGGGTST